MLIFLKIMHYESDEIRTLEVLKIKFFFVTQPWWADF